MTRRRMLALGAAGLGALAVGDRGSEVVTTTRPLARGRAVIHPGKDPRLPRPGVMPPRLAPVAARTEAGHRLPDLYPTAPPHAIALTIDDGPQPEWTPKMLDLLAEFEVQATFSLIGIQVKLFPKLAERIVQAGHQLGMVPIFCDIYPRVWSLPTTKHFKRAMLKAKGGDNQHNHNDDGDRAETI